jgi:hypothetical protein
MYVPLETLPDESRVWIYQSNRKFSDEEFAAIESAVREFVDGWNAHGKGLEASYALKYNRFIILAVNSEVQPASGCSIDDSVHFIQGLEKQYGVDLLDKMNVTYLQGGHIAHKTLADFRKMAKDKSVSENTIVFNNLVNTLGEFREFWEVPARESWHARFF